MVRPASSGIRATVAWRVNVGEQDEDDGPSLRDVMGAIQQLSTRISALEGFSQRRGKTDYPEFNGGFSPDDYLDWVSLMEKIFKSNEVSEHRMVKIAASKLTNSAARWWEKICRLRDREYKEKVRDWEKMKRVMRKRFVPRGYRYCTFSPSKLRIHEPLKDSTPTMVEIHTASHDSAPNDKSTDELFEIKEVDFVAAVSYPIEPMIDVSCPIEPIREDYSNLFPTELPRTLALLCDIQHYMALIPWASFPNRRHYRPISKEHEMLIRQMQELIDKWVFCKSMSHIDNVFGWLIWVSTKVKVMNSWSSSSSPRCMMQVHIQY